MPSEVLWAVRLPGCAEKRARPLDSAFLQFANTLGGGQVVEIEGTEIDGREIGYLQLELRRFLGARDLVPDPPAAGVPGTEVVVELDDDLVVGGVRTPRQRRLDVDEAQP